MSTDLATPRSLPRGPTAFFGALAALGVVVFLAALATDADRAYRVYLHNWLLWAALAQGGLVLSCAMRLTNANWQGPIQRVTESLGAYVPVSLVLFAVIWLGRHHLYEWTHHPVHGKEWWFRDGFTFGRDLFVLLWVTAMSFVYLYISLRPAMGSARDSATGLRKGLYRRWTAGWRGEEAERDLATRRGRKMAAVLVLSYALGYSVLAVDLIMGLAPHWVSTMFPAYYAWGGFLSAVGMTTLVCLSMRNGPDLTGEITTNRMHDLGKMMFAFSIFWMYLFWSQYLVIWYGNIPEETGFVAARLGSEFLQDTWYLEGFWARVAEPYARLTLATWILLWVLPFWVLLGQRPKKTPAILGTICAGSLLGFWLERYILVTPSLVSPDDVLAGAAITPFGWIELGVGAGFLGIFFLCFLTFSKFFPGAIPQKTA
jgi:Ni/Fe-hydrogenase subunit HybB-like protein